MKFKVFSSLVDEELKSKLYEINMEIFNHKLGKMFADKKNNIKLSTLKKDVARIMTVMKQRKLGLSNV